MKDCEGCPLTKGYLSPRISGEFYDCSMPITFDQYKKCGFGCLYCFARYQRETNPATKDYLTDEVKTVDVEKIKRLFLGKSPNNPIYKKFIKKRKVLQWGSMADPFCALEEKYGVGYELLEFFADIQYPIRFSTKGILCTKGKYWELLKSRAGELKDKWAFMYSIITADQSMAAVIERGSPTPNERFAALKKLKSLGYYTIHRLRPFLLGITEKTLNEMLKKDKEVGVDAISLEFFCLDLRVTKRVKDMYKTLGRLAGIDYLKFYHKESVVKGYERLNPQVKEKWIFKIRDFCLENNILFAISDPHYKELNQTGSCCGLPDEGPLGNYEKIQWTQMIRDAREHYIQTGKCKELRLQIPLWTKDHQARTMTSVLNAFESARRRREMISDALRSKWNNPNRGSSPYKYFYGRLNPIGLDKNKDVIYVYKPSEIDKKEREEKK